MTMKEFKKYLNQVIEYYEEKVRQTENTSVHCEAVAVLKELKDIQKVINI